MKRQGTTSIVTVAMVSAVIFGGVAGHAEVIHVPADHPTIQAAIDAAQDGDEIVVAPGGYFETINLLGKAITLRSAAGPEKTIIKGQGNATAVTCDSGEGPDTVIEGFTVRNTWNPFGSPDAAGMNNIGSSPTVVGCHFLPDTPPWLSGAGMYNEGGSPTIIDCTFSMVGLQECSGCGGMRNNNANVFISECTFANNENCCGGAGILSMDSHVVVIGSTFMQNRSHVGLAGAIGHSGGTLEIMESVFVGNRTDFGDWSGAVSDGPGGSGPTTVTIENCLFENNHGGDRGVGAVSAAGSIIGSSFIGNSGGFGGAVRLASGFIEECEFSENSSILGPGAVTTNGSPTILNSSFRNNTGDIYLDGFGAGAINSFGSGNPQIGGSEFCGNSPGHILGAWRNLGGNLFGHYCPIGDLNGDGAVNVLDVLILLGAWGTCADPGECPADLNGDGDVDVFDLLILLTAWG